MGITRESGQEHSSFRSPTGSWNLPRWATLLVLTGGLIACSKGPVMDTEAPVSTPIPSTLIPSTLPATPTDIPAAAIVAGQVITISEYEAELARFEAGQQALGIELATLDEYQDQVLQVLIDRALLAQAARDEGIHIDEAEIASKVEAIIQEIGDQAEFEAWLAENDYSVASFREALMMDALADQMADQLADGVEMTAEQVHARHILLSSPEEAEEARGEILAGASFEDIAWARSLDPSTRLAGGDLGWFPRGFLTLEEVEQVAFSLDTGEISPVFESAFGFHILEVLGREVRPLSPAALQEARHRAVSTWLAEQRETVNIEIRVEP